MKKVIDTFNGNSSRIFRAILFVTIISSMILLVYRENYVAVAWAALSLSWMSSAFGWSDIYFKRLEFSNLKIKQLERELETYRTGMKSMNALSDIEKYIENQIKLANEALAEADKALGKDTVKGGEIKTI